MLARNAFILAAGKGTRMGPLGNLLPKPLFPIFEKTLLDLQISFARKFQVDKIFINAHHLADQLKQQVIQRYPDQDIKVVFEPALLDIGGGIHNVAEQLGYQGELLILNSDILFFFDPLEEKEFFKNKMQQTVQLLGLPIKKGGSYNQLVMDPVTGQFKQVSPPNQEQDYLTYSGICRINLQDLPKDQGISNFFKTVANPQRCEVGVFGPSKDLSYCDFGTSDLYFQNLIKIFNEFKSKKNSALISFLAQHGALDSLALKGDRYLATDASFFLVPAVSGGVAMGTGPVPAVPQNGIYIQQQFGPIMWQ